MTYRAFEDYLLPVSDVMDTDGIGGQTNPDRYIAMRARLPCALKACRKLVSITAFVDTFNPTIRHKGQQPPSIPRQR